MFFHGFLISLGESHFQGIIVKNAFAVMTDNNGERRLSFTEAGHLKMPGILAVGSLQCFFEFFRRNFQSDHGGALFF